MTCQSPTSASPPSGPWGTSTSPDDESMFEAPQAGQPPAANTQPLPLSSPSPTSPTSPTLPLPQPAPAVRPSRMTKSQRLASFVGGVGILTLILLAASWATYVLVKPALKPSANVKPATVASMTAAQGLPATLTLTLTLPGADQPTILRAQAKVLFNLDGTYTIAQLTPQPKSAKSALLMRQSLPAYW